MNKKQKTVVLVLAAAVAAYMLYRWYMNRQAGGGTGQLGTNLNSIAPELVAGSTGPNSGLNYYQGSTTIYLSENVSQQGKSPLGNRTFPLKAQPLPMQKA